MSGPKRSWPLLLVAAAAFVPGLGILFASIGLTWGLVSDRPRAMLGVIVAAAGGLLNFAGIALLVWFMEDDPAMAAVNAAGAKRDLAKLVVAIEEYRTTTGEYPPSLLVFTQFPRSLKLVNVTDASTGTFHLPRMYEYARSADGRQYDVFGVGLDGEPRTGDDVRPEVSDSLAGRSGYRPSEPPSGVGVREIEDVNAEGER